MSDFRILNADLEDPAHASGIVEILDSYAREEVGGARPLRDDVRDRLVGELRARNNAVILLATARGRPVGVAICFLGFSTFVARPLLNVHDLAVLPEFRGRGVGRALLERVELHAIESGCCKLTLEVRADNERARSLYERLGFGHFAPGEGGVPTLFLEKRLQAGAGEGR